MAMARGGITAGQKQFCAELGKERTARGLVARAVAEGTLDDWTAQQASALIGRMQASRSPMPALRIRPVKEPRVRGERANKKRRASR